MPKPERSLNAPVAGHVVAAAFVMLAAVVAAQRQGGPAGPPPDPLVRENATIKLGAHTFVIPDANVGAVPNVGIVVGSRATLVIDPGLGRRNGETVLREVGKVSRNTDLYVASTHFHPEHTMGYVAFPTAKYVNSKTQERNSPNPECRWSRASPAVQPHGASC